VTDRTEPLDDADDAVVVAAANIIAGAARVVTPPVYLLTRRDAVQLARALRDAGLLRDESD
jgi:hypothetical protein